MERKKKRYLYIIFIILLGIASFHFATLALQAIWLSATPNYDIEVARKDLWISGSIFIALFIAMVFLIIKLLRTRKQVPENN